MNSDPKKYAMLHLRMLRYSVGNVGRRDSKCRSFPAPSSSAQSRSSSSLAASLGDAEVGSVSSSRVTPVSELDPVSWTCTPPAAAVAATAAGFSPAGAGYCQGLLGCRIDSGEYDWWWLEYVGTPLASSSLWSRGVVVVVVVPSCDMTSPKTVQSSVAGSSAKCRIPDATRCSVDGREILRRWSAPPPEGEDEDEEERRGSAGRGMAAGESRRLCGWNSWESRSEAAGWDSGWLGLDSLAVEEEKEIRWRAGKRGTMREAIRRGLVEAGSGR